MPVEAVRPLGMEAIISGSTTATMGMSCGSTQTNLRLLSHVGDDIVDGHLGGRAGGGGNGDDGHAGLLGGRHALQAAHVGELGVVDDDADGLGGVHGGAAADGDDVIRARGLEGGHAGLDVLNGGVGLDVGEDLVARGRSVSRISVTLAVTP